MPEGHTIHRLARDLNATLRPTPVRSSSPQGLFADGAAELDGQPLERAEAWGKHLFLRFESRPVLHIHLGLIGKLRPKGRPTAPIEGQIRLRLESVDETWDLTGPMTCALIDPGEVDEITGALGPDPLRHRRGSERFAAALEQRSVPIGAALLDQAVIAGIGNVYRSELCFLAGVRPTRPARSLDAAADQIWRDAVDQLRRGVRLNRIVTRDPREVGTTPGRIRDEDRLYAYKREGLPCHRCGTEIRRTDIAQRKAWYCPECQR